MLQRGRDCIVMLHLVYACFAKEYPGKSLQTIYIKDKDPFQVGPLNVQQSKKMKKRQKWDLS